jgi:phage gp36-like protein
MTYATVEQANEYHAARLSAEAWFALSSAKHLPALQSATDALDAYAAAHGGWKDFLPEVEVPQAIADACCMVALTLMDPAAQERIRAQQQGVVQTSIGSASETYTGGVRAESLLITPAIVMRLSPYLTRAGGGVYIL